MKSQTHDAKQLRRIINKPNVTQGIKLYKADISTHGVKPPNSPGSILVIVV